MSKIRDALSKISVIDYLDAPESVQDFVDIFLDEHVSTDEPDEKPLSAEFRSGDKVEIVQPLGFRGEFDRLVVPLLGQRGRLTTLFNGVWLVVLNDSVDDKMFSADDKVYVHPLGLRKVN